MENLSKLCAEMPPSSWIPESDEDSGDINVLEIRSHVGDISNTLQTCSLSNANVEDWLKNVSSSVPEQDPDPVRVALVWVNIHPVSAPWRFDIQKSNLDSVVEKFGIKPAYRYCFSGAAGMAFFPTKPSENEETRSYCLFIHAYFMLVWSHNSTSATSQGVCFATPWITPAMQALLENQISMASHPMFLAAIAGLMLLQLLESDLPGLGKHIGLVENRTGYHGWTATTLGAAEGDFATLSAKVSGFGTSLAVRKRNAKLIHEMIGFICDCCAQEASGATVMTSQRQVVESTLLECITDMKRRLSIQEIQIEFLLHRTQIQMTALYNLIAQKDANLNITIAEDSRTLASASKRDSSSMKTLAAVTVAFLPGTFVSSLFAMPLLNWNAGQNASVVNGKFWIYWAFTIPLTFFTMTIWLIWTHWQTILHRTQDRKAREQLANGIRADQDAKMGQMV